MNQFIMTQAINKQEYSLNKKLIVSSSTIIFFHSHCSLRRYTFGKICNANIDDTLSRNINIYCREFDNDVFIRG